MNKRFDIVGIGHPCVDYLVHINQIPRPNQSSRVLDASWQCGGKIPTGLVASARCGLSCALIGAMGDDLFGQYCRFDFENHGIDLTYVTMHEGCTTDIGVALSEEETNGRNIIYRRGTYPRPTLADIDLSVIEQAKYLFVSAVDETSIAAAKYAKEHDVEVLIDADNQNLAYYDEIIPYIDYFVASEFVYHNTYEDDDQYELHMRELMARGPKVVVYTFGEHGCRVLSDQGYYELPAFQVKVIDTTGAGDTFHGAFFYGLTHGYSYKDTAIFASAVSAIKCTCIGGRAGIPTPDVTKKFIETGIIDTTELDQRVADYSWGLNTYFKELTKQ